MNKQFSVNARVHQKDMEMKLGMKNFFGPSGIKTRDKIETALISLMSVCLVLLLEIFLGRSRR